MKKALFILLFICGLTINAQEERTLQTGNFSEIKVFDGISAKLIKAEENKVVVSGEDISKVDLINRNGRLKIRMDIKEIFEGYRTFVNVYHTDAVTLIDANENAFISSDDTIKQVDLELRSQEGGEIDLTIDVQRLDVKSVTGGKIDTRGTARNQDISINTGGQYEADALLTEQTTVSVSAGGRAYINASEYVKAKVKAGGTIRIYGNPKVIDKQTFLGGTITEQ